MRGASKAEFAQWRIMGDDLLAMLELLIVGKIGCFREKDDEFSLQHVSLLQG